MYKYLCRNALSSDVVHNVNDFSVFNAMQFKIQIVEY